MGAEFSNDESQSQNARVQQIGGTQRDLAKEVNELRRTTEQRFTEVERRLVELERRLGELERRSG